MIQVVRADLDGDGIEEVLFTFEHVDRFARDARASGDFSIVVARYPDADRRRSSTTCCSSHVVADSDGVSRRPAAPRVLAIADLNGDGTMEVAIAPSYWEGAGITVYEFRDGALQRGDDVRLRQLTSRAQSGVLPCLRWGRRSRLLSSISSAAATSRRVSAGSITEST